MVEKTQKQENYVENNILLDLEFHGKKQKRNTFVIKEDKTIFLQVVLLQ